MSVKVELPALGESVVEGMISRWLVKEGDTVEVDQPLVEVSTDKVDAEIPAPSAGIVDKILVAEGETVPVGTVLVELASGAGAAARSSEAPNRQPAAQAQAQAAGAAAAAPADAGVRATPVAERMAADASVDLGAVSGSGVSGRITKADVARHAASAEREVAAPEREVAAPEREVVAPEPLAARPAAPERAAPATRAASAAASRRRPAYLDYQLQEGDRVIPMTPLRKIVAEHMVLSKATSPHVGTVAEIDMTRVVKLRGRHKNAFREQHGYNLTFLPFIVHATVRALRDHPRLNASVVEEAIVEKRDIHIGIAVETDKGLVVPVVRNADRLSLMGLAAAIDDLSSRARNRKLSPDDLRGGTFTISNPGRQGNLYGFAIINQPQVGILRVGEMVKRPVVREVDGEDVIVIRTLMHLALSYDHRAVDGAPANGFLFRVRELLEEAEFDL